MSNWFAPEKWSSGEHYSVAARHEPVRDPVPEVIPAMDEGDLGSSKMTDPVHEEVRLHLVIGVDEAIS